MRHENLVIGATLDSLFFAIRNGYALVYSQPQLPPFYEESSTRQWQEAYFFLSLAGLIPFADKVVSIRLRSRPSGVSLLTSNKRYEVDCSNLFVFDDTLLGLPMSDSLTSEYSLVHDYMNVRGILPSTFEDFATNSAFVERVKFYKSSRADRPDLRDICAISTLPSKDLSLGEYSELYARFRVEELLSERIESPPRVESHNRVVTPLGRYIHKDTSAITFVYEKQERPDSSSSPYLSFIMEKFKDAT